MPSSSPPRGCHGCGGDVEHRHGCCRGGGHQGGSDQTKRLVLDILRGFRAMRSSQKFPAAPRRPHDVRFSVFRGLSLAIGGISAAFPQSGPLVCSTQAGTPALVRAEGVAEKLSDIVITCTGGTAYPG